jgi:purine catabolism regulator
LNKPHYVFLFKLENKATVDLKHEAINTYSRKIKDLLTKQVELSGYQLLISSKLDTVHALIPEQFFIQRNINVKEFGQSIVTQIEEPPCPVKIILGISNLCSDLSKIHPGYKAVNKAMEIAKLKKNKNTVILAADLGHLLILLDARRPEELQHYADQLLEVLYGYDLQYSTEFLKTLYYYIDSDSNLHKTARKMNISISGMRYRLSRIKEISNIDLTHASTRFEVQIALEIYLVLGKIEF